MGQVLETAAMLANQSDSMEGSFVYIGRMVRVARIVRIVRVIRVMRFLRGFKVLINAIYGTMKSCAWAVMLMLIIMYVFAVIFAQSTADFLLAVDPEGYDYAD